MLRGFSFVMIVGIIIGTYSSIFIAAPVIVWEEWKQKRAARHPGEVPAAPKAGKAAAAKGR